MTFHQDPVMLKFLEHLGFGRRKDYPSSESEASDSDGDSEGSWETVDSSSSDDSGSACDRCAVCGVRASLRCGRCNQEVYCGRAHQKDDWKAHKKECNPQAQAAGDARGAGAATEQQGAAPEAAQDSPLLTLPRRALLAVCRHLGALDLARLGMVCRGLRGQVRDAESWSHVTLPLPRWHSRNMEDRYGLLRLAPALHSLSISYSWPPVNLLRCTNNVKVLDMEWGDDLPEDFQLEKLIRVLKHYKGHLQVLKLNPLVDLKVLKAIDGLHIKELYMMRQLVKTYPGSSKVVTEMEFGKEVSDEVLANLIRACHKTLVTFKVEKYFIDKNPWANTYHCAVRRALKKCANLERASITTWGKMSVVNSFPKLRQLCLFDFGDEHHGFAQHVFQTSPVMQNLECLTLQLGYQGHRGLIKAAAQGCRNLKELRLMYSSVDKMFVTVTVDVPRDLHVLLGHLEGLKRLLLSIARVPFTVFKALAAGALPNLVELNLRFCGATKKGRAALAALKASRPELLVTGDRLQPARRKMAYNPLNACVIPAWRAPPAGSRCEDALCQEASDCEDEDPVEEPGDHEPRPHYDTFDVMFALGDGSDDD